METSQQRDWRTEKVLFAEMLVHRLKVIICWEEGLILKLLSDDLVHFLAEICELGGLRKIAGYISRIEFIRELLQHV